MTFLRVDEEACVRCGACADVCVTGAVALAGDGPEQAGDYCIACGHCVAVCPTAALDNDNCPQKAQVVLYGAGAADAEDTAALLLRSRRSIRCYEDKPVPRGEIEKLLNMARFAPTGGNTQGMVYLAIDNRAALKRITLATVEWMEDELRKGTAHARFMESFSARFRQEGRDVILWDAPCLIIAIAGKGRRIPSPRENAVFSLLYAQLYAPSLGLGTCWAGAVEAAVASGHPSMREILQGYGDIAVAGMLMAGYPTYRYQRLVDREPLSLAWG